MDADRFDRLSRAVGGASRRGLLAGLFAVLASGADGLAKPKRNRPGRGGVSAQGPCGDGGIRDNRCKNDKDCCTGYCEPRKNLCRCRQRGEPCTADRNCCARGGQTLTCQGANRKRCQPPAACGPATCPNGCCDAAGVCQTGTTPDLCGAGGERCSPANCPAALPTGFIGAWAGRVDQPGVFYQTELTLTGGADGAVVGTSNYPTLTCGGNLVLIDVSPDRRIVTVREDLTFGFGRCVDASIIVLTLDSADQLDYAIALLRANGKLARQIPA